MQTNNYCERKKKEKESLNLTITDRAALVLRLNGSGAGQQRTDDRVADHSSFLHRDTRKDEEGSVLFDIRAVQNEQKSKLRHNFNRKNDQNHAALPHILALLNNFLAF